jgi:hypothetical protein
MQVTAHRRGFRHPQGTVALSDRPTQAGRIYRPEATQLASDAGLSCSPRALRRLFCCFGSWRGRPSLNATVPGQVIDVYVSTRRDSAAARCFSSGRWPLPKSSRWRSPPTRRRVPHVLEQLAPSVGHWTEAYANNRMEADHRQLKRRLRPMRGLKRISQPGLPSPGTRSFRTSAAATTNWALTNR